jgi:hypothetical protein
VGDGAQLVASKTSLNTTFVIRARWLSVASDAKSRSAAASASAPELRPRASTAADVGATHAGSTSSSTRASALTLGLREPALRRFPFRLGRRAPPGRARSQASSDEPTEHGVCIHALSPQLDVRAGNKPQRSHAVQQDNDAGGVLVRKPDDDRRLARRTRREPHQPSISYARRQGCGRWRNRTRLTGRRGPARLWLRQSGKPWLSNTPAASRSGHGDLPRTFLALRRYLRTSGEEGHETGVPVALRSGLICVQREDAAFVRSRLRSPLRSRQSLELTTKLAALVLRWLTVRRRSRRRWRLCRLVATTPARMVRRPLERFVDPIAPALRDDAIHPFSGPVHPPCHGQSTATRGDSCRRYPTMR